MPKHHSEAERSKSIGRCQNLSIEIFRELSKYSCQTTSHADADAGDEQSDVLLQAAPIWPPRCIKMIGKGCS